MEQFLARFTATDLLAVGIGFALLAFGRRLYWLALGGTGFFAGLWLASHVFEVGSTGLELGLGFLLGVLGAVLAVVAQKIAIGIAGFVMGGLASLWIVSLFDPVILREPSPWLLLAGLIGAAVGIAFASTLFEAALIAFSSLVGAFLVASRSGIGPPQENWFFLLLLILGIMMQSRRGRRRHRHAEE